MQKTYKTDRNHHTGQKISEPDISRLCVVLIAGSFLQKHTHVLALKYCLALVI